MAEHEATMQAADTHGQQEQEHADHIAQRIVQLGDDLLGLMHGLRD